MIKITYDGFNNIQDAIDAKVMEATTEQFREQLEDYRCPDHAEPIESVRVSGGRRTSTGYDDVQVNICGCCDRATEDATALLGLA